MVDSPRRDWKVLAELAAQEQDPNKLLKIVTELNAALQERARPAEGRRPKRVLVVDDDVNVRDTLVPVLQKRGYEADFAATVSDAVSAIEKRTFDALVCDLNITNSGDGFEVVMAMRKIRPSSVIVLLTGFPGFDTAVKGIRQSIDDYLVKPADYDKLIHTLEDRLQVKQRF